MADGQFLITWGSDVRKNAQNKENAFFIQTNDTGKYKIIDLIGIGDLVLITYKDENDRTTQLNMTYSIKKEGSDDVQSFSNGNSIVDLSEPGYYILTSTGTSGDISHSVDMYLDLQDDLFTVSWFSDEIKEAQESEKKLEVQVGKTLNFSYLFGTTAPIEISYYNSNVTIEYRLYLGETLVKKVSNPETDYFTISEYGDYVFSIQASYNIYDYNENDQYVITNVAKACYYINLNFNDFFDVTWKDEKLSLATNTNNAILINKHDNGIYFLIDFIGSQDAIEVINTKNNSNQKLELSYILVNNGITVGNVDFSEPIKIYGVSDYYSLRVTTQVEEDIWSRSVYFKIVDSPNSKSSINFGSIFLSDAVNKEKAIEIDRNTDNNYLLSDFIDDNQILVTFYHDDGTTTRIKPTFSVVAEDGGEFKSFVDSSVSITSDGYYLLRLSANEPGVYCSAYIYFNIYEFLKFIWNNDNIKNAQEEENALKILKKSDNSYTLMSIFNTTSPVNVQYKETYWASKVYSIKPKDADDSEKIDNLDSNSVFQLTETGYYVFNVIGSYTGVENNIEANVYIYLDYIDNFFTVEWGSDEIKDAQDKEKAIKIKETEEKVYTFNDFFDDVTPVIISKSDINGQEVEELDVTYFIKEEGSETGQEITNETEFELEPLKYYTLEISASYDNINYSNQIYLFVKAPIKITLQDEKWKNVDTPADLGNRFEYFKKDDFLENFLTIESDEEDIILDYTITKYPNDNFDVGDDVDDINGVGYYSIDISSENYDISNDSDKFFYGVVSNINSVVIKVKDEFKNMTDKTRPLYTTLETYKSKDEFESSYLDVLPENADDVVILDFTINKYNDSEFTEGDSSVVEDITGVGYYEIIVSSSSHYIIPEYSDTIFYIIVDKVNPLITIESENIEIYYDGEEHDVSEYVTITPNGLTANYNLKNVKNIGTYNITVQTEETDYYNSASETFVVSVIKQTPVINVESDTLDIYYTGEYFDVSEYVTITPDNLELIFNIRNIKEVGTYNISVSTIENSYYYSARKDFVINIIKQTPVINISEQNIEIYYDGEEHDITGYVSVNPDILIPEFSVETVKDVDNYEIEIDVEETAYYYAAHEVLYVKVIKRTPTITLATPQKITLNYTGEEQDITKFVTATVNPSNLNLSFSRKTVKEVGIYSVILSTIETDYYYSKNIILTIEVLRSPNLIEHDDVLNMIKNSLLQVMDEEYNYYKDYKVVLAKEQEFIKLKQAEPKAIYIVIKFGSASINFSQTVIPITLTAMSEQNKLDVCQKLLTDFVNKYNLVSNEDSTIRQIYELPVVTSNFNKVFEGFRSVLFVNGYFVISKNAMFYKLQSLKKDVYCEYNSQYIRNFEINKIEFLQKVKNISGIYNFYYNNGWFLNDEEIESLSDYGISVSLQNTINNNIKVLVSDVWEEVPLLTFNFSTDFQLDSQPFYNVSNFTKSETKYGILSFNISTFMLSDIDLINKALGVALKQNDVNSNFRLKIILKDGLMLEDDFKLVSVSSHQDVAEIPGIGLGFTN